MKNTQGLGPVIYIFIHEVDFFQSSWKAGPFVLKIAENHLEVMALL